MWKMMSRMKVGDVVERKCGDGVELLRMDHVDAVTSS